MKSFLLAFSFLFTIFGLRAQNNKYKEIMDQDWAELKTYREANKKLKAKDIKPVAVFMGNSITEGWVNASPGFFKENNYIGRGIGGQTSPQMLLRFMQDVIDLQPEVVVILAGTNDIAGNTGYASVDMITDNIKAMAQLAETNNIEVVLSSILPVADYPWRPGLEPVEKIAAVNTWLREYAQMNNFIYLDYFSHMKNSENGMRAELSEDGVHPNKKAYSLMQPLAKEAIEKALKN
ncbi:SGNH/GDSL hydrolase family protein [Salegentibacter chungangensis]|uniref:SGNH/GDSL hydrolase family protein n=1 Tax=Salegentibacter chungangensis TaxID=1335724 RepID=A0ABW3NRJ5_9FLAO